MAIHISAIIVNWNQPHITRECVQKISGAASSAKNVIDLNVIIVDNGSTDESITILRELPGVTLIPLSSNRGFAVACNIALNHCRKDDICLFLNNDAYLGEGALDELIQPVLDGSTDMLSPIIYRTDKNESVWSSGSYINKLTLRHSNVKINRAIHDDRASHSHNTKLIECDAITFCVALIPLSTFQKIGSLDESYFMYYEDWDFCLRAKRKGLHIHVCPNVKGYHAVATSSGGRWSANERFLTGNSLVKFYRKNIEYASPVFAWLFLIAYVIGYSVRMLLRGKYKATLAYLRGIWCGIRTC